MFKWLKQHLNVRRFPGRSENAVRIRIYVAMIAFLLLRILHHTAVPGLKTTTALRPPKPQLLFPFQWSRQALA